MNADLALWLAPYGTTLAALGTMAALMLVQLLVADVMGIRHRHVPGTPVAADHANILFRVTRTVSNTNESIAIFICALLFCIFGAASPTYTGYAAWLFVLARVVYTVCYYTNQQILRSTSFALSLLALLALIVLGFVA